MPAPSMALPAVRFERFEGVDVDGADLALVPGAAGDAARLEAVCGQLRECAAFNLNGWLKLRAAPRVPSQTDLYVRIETRAPPVLPAPDTPANLVPALRVYVYPEPEELARVAAPADYKYGAEPRFMRLLQASGLVVADPAGANLFVVPVRCTAHRYSVADRVAGQVAAEHAARRLVDHVRHQWPFFNRSAGADHAYLCAHDMGASCLRQTDALFRKNAIGLLNTGDLADADFVPHKDVTLPPNVGDGCPTCTQGGGPAPTGSTPPALFRRHLAFFAGQFDRGRVRPRVKELFWAHDGFVLIDGFLAPADYQALLQTSVFCLFLRGHRAWSPRLLDALWHGCIPVIVSDGYDLPLAELIDWNAVALLVPEAQLPTLPGRLRAVPQGRRQAMQLAGWRARAWLTWPAQPYDPMPNAFVAVLTLLARRVHALSLPPP